MEPEVRDKLHEIESRITTSDGNGVQARWASGRYLLELRGTRKQLPNGMLKEMETELKLKRSELSARMKFAEKFPTEDVVSDAVRKFPSWHLITHGALIDKPRIAKPKLSRLQRMTAAVKELDLATIDLGELREHLSAVQDRLKAAASLQKQKAVA